MNDLLCNLTLEKFNLKYYKLKNENKFGVKIMKEENAYSESVEVNGITEDEEEIKIFIDKLIKGSVTPVTLGYIVEDYIIEKVRRNLKVKEY